MAEKTLLLVRHAHRQILASREADNGLSEKGEKQAKRLRKYIDAHFKKKHAVLYSSPKRRCVQTLEPLGEEWGLPVQELDLLVEEEQLTANTAKFQKLCKESDEKLIVACSHGDWIPVFIERYAKMTIGLEKGGFVEFEIDDEGGMKMKKLMQEVED